MMLLAGGEFFAGRYFPLFQQSYKALSVQRTKASRGKGIEKTSMTAKTSYEPRRGWGENEGRHPFFYKRRRGAKKGTRNFY